MKVEAPYRGTAESHAPRRRVIFSAELGALSFEDFLCWWLPESFRI